MMFIPGWLIALVTFPGVIVHEGAREARSLHPLALLSFPLVLTIYIGNLARVIWFDLIFALAVGVGLARLTAGLIL